MAESNWPLNESYGTLNDQNRKMTTFLREESHCQENREQLPWPDQGVTPDYLRGYHRQARAQHNMTNYLTKRFLNNLNKKMFCSKTPLAKLTRTVIPELRVEEPAKDKYIIVRIIEEGFEYSLNGYITVVEDHVGNVRNLVIHNFPLEELTGSTGCALVIKEPYFGMSVFNNSRYVFIRTDCPSDILMLFPTFNLYHHLASQIEWKNQLEERSAHDILRGDFVPENAEQWLARGVQLLGRNQNAAAREAFRLGIRCCEQVDDPNYKKLRMKLLNMHILFDCCDWATKDCDDLLKEFPNNSAALLKLGLTYILKRHFRDAFNTLKDCCALYPGYREAERRLSQITNRAGEEKGEIDIERLRRESQKNPFDKLQCADYIAQAVQVRRDQGLELITDVAKGHILFASRALGTCYPRQHPEIEIERDNVEGQLVDLMCSENVKELAHLIYKNPNHIGSQVYKLFAGSSTVDEPIKQFCYPEEKKEGICDVEKIRAIYQCNKFTITGIVNGKVIEKGEGLFSRPSYWNHSCSPNVDIEFYNNIMVGRANRNLEYTTELTISYVPLDIDLAQRTKMLKRRGIEECLCTKCKQERECFSTPYSLFSDNEKFLNELLDS